MNSAEATTLLEQRLKCYRTKAYSELVRLINLGPETAEVIGPTKIKYQIEISALWDDEPNGVVRVIGSIDDGGVRAYVPLCSDFLLSPDGTFVDE